MISELFPLMFSVTSFILAMFILGHNRRENISQEQYTPSTKNIDKLINNSNSGEEDIRYKQVLEGFDISYVAWMAIWDEERE